jgi:signal transduction histidine kinase
MPDRVAFETARLELAKLRVQAVGEHDRALETALRLCARTLRIERVGYWVFSEDALALQNRLQYTRSTDELGAGDVLVGTRYPTYWKALREKRVIAVEDAVNGPPTSELAASYLKPLGIGAMLDAPVFRAGALIGVVCHEHVGGPRAWTVDEVSFASTSADLVSMMLEQGDRLIAEERVRTYLGTAIAAEQLAVMEGLCRAISHDFANLFAVVELVAGAMGSAAARPDKLEELAGSLRSVSSVGAGLLGQMRRFGHRQSESGPAMPLAQVIERVVPILGTLTRDVATVEVSLALGAADVAALEPDRIEQLILNLILNARDAIAGHGKIEVSARRDGDTLEIGVADDGTGMSPEVLARIWEPYFTTKAQGTGLGLATVRAIVDEAAGTIEVTSAPGQGTRFTVRVPAAAPAIAAPGS